MDENEQEVIEQEEIEQDENEQEVIEHDNSEILSEINTNLVTINSNITTTYALLEDIETRLDAQENVQKDSFVGVSFLANISLFCVICAFLILCMKYLRRLF